MTEREKDTLYDHLNILKADSHVIESAINRSAYIDIIFACSDMTKHINALLLYAKELRR